MGIVIDYTPLLISFKLAFLTTLILFLIVLPLIYWIEKLDSKFKPFINSFLTLPLVLPPTVIGFYLIYLFSPELLGRFLPFKILFTFEGILIASIIYSFPFMYQPIYSAIEKFDKRLIEVSYTLGKSRLETFLKIILPNIKPSIISAIVLTFAHTIGEFGVVLMVGGSIPGVSKVASIAIYEYVENLEFNKAHVYSLVLLAFSFFILLFINRLKKENALY